MDVAHSSPAKKNPTGSSKWPLDPRLEVSLRMKAASSSMADQKVSAAAVGRAVWEETSRSQQVSSPQSALHRPRAQPWAGFHLSEKAHGGSCQPWRPHRQDRDARGLLIGQGFHEIHLFSKCFVVTYSMPSTARHWRYRNKQDGGGCRLHGAYNLWVRVSDTV